MKVIHWLFLILFVIGALFVWHNYQSHGGTNGIRQGLGFGGMGGGSYT